MIARIDTRRLALLSLSAALFLSGLIFMPFAQHVFWAPEALATRLLAPIALLILSVQGKGAALASQRHGVGLLWLLLGCWSLSSAVAFRQDLAMRELAVWLSAPLVLAAAWDLSQDRDARNRIVFIILAAGLLQAIYGVIQSAGLEASLTSLLPQKFGFNRLNWAASYGGRAGAFLGNPNFLGGHLAMLLPLSVALAMNDRGSRTTKLLRWSSAATIAAGLVATQTRGAWLGAAVGLSLLLWICRKRMPGLITRNSLGLKLFFGATLSATLVFFISHAQNISRITGIFKGDEELARRLVLMSSSLKLVLQHFWLGVGPGNFRLFFPAYQAQGLSHEQLLNRPYIVSDHAHNDLIQMACDSGVVAALLWSALLIWTFRALWLGLKPSGEPLRQEQGHSEKLWLAGIIAGLAALQIHGLANFPFLIAPTQMTAWALAAIGLRLANLERVSEDKKPGSWRFAALAAGMALFLFSAFDAGRMLMKDTLWWVSEGEQKLGHNDKAEVWLFKTLEIDRKEDRLWILHAKSILDKNFVINATGSYKEALRLNPHFHEARVGLGRAYVGIAEYAKAEETLAVVAQEAPNLKDLWEPLAASLYMQGKYEQAVTAYDWAIFFQAATAQMLENKSAALGSLGRYSEAIQVLDAAEKMEPGRAKNYVNRAITHIKMGIKLMARQDLREAARRDPSDTQVKDLMKAVR